jgi:hypothetical protein
MILQELSVRYSREQSMPNLGMVPMLDTRNGCIQLVDTSSKAVRFMKKYITNKLNYFKETFSKSRFKFVNTRVDESYVTKLLGFKSR